MALLTDLMEHPLDRSYQDRATAREARGEPAAAGGRSVLLLVACVALGLLLVVAAQTLRVPEERASGQRDQIIGQIEGKQKDNSALQRRIRSLRTDTGRLRSQAVGSPDASALAARLARAQTAAGTVAVSGPGAIITLDDSESAAKRDGTDPRVDGARQDVLTSQDLQIIVNGLWQAGAEAISINRTRLTSLSAIRFAGEAIVVDFRPIARPYVITAIGPPDDFWQTFRDGSGGTYLSRVAKLIGMDVGVENKDKVTVPASSSVGLREAKPAEPTEPSASPASSSREKEAP